MTPPSWLELLVRMIAGEQEEQPFVGVLEVLGGHHGDWPSSVRVFKDRERYRVESLDGTLLTIRDATHVYVFHPPGHEPDDHVPGVPTRVTREAGIHPGAHGDTIARRDPRDWRGDDFTTPTSSPRAVTYLGRPAWEIELAPSEHKISALVMVVDAVNGMTYEQRSVELEGRTRWSEIVPVESHPQELFVWDGDVYEYWVSSGPVSEDDERQWARERAERVAALGLGVLDVTVGVDLHAYEVEDDGSFDLGLEVRIHGVLVRRPTSSDPWEPDVSYPFVERWSDDRWDWCVASDSSAEHLVQIRRQLAEAGPDRQ